MRDARQVQVIESRQEPQHVGFASAGSTEQNRSLTGNRAGAEGTAMGKDIVQPEGMEDEHRSLLEIQLPVSLVAATGVQPGAHRV